MFEDSTFESAGRIRTRSRRWMIAAFAFNAFILLAFVLIPLISPEALPRQAFAFLIEAPAPTPETQKPPQQPVQTTHQDTEMAGGQFVAPSKIPHGILIPSGPEPAIDLRAAWDPNSTGSDGDPFGKRRTVTVVRPEVKTLRVSSMVEEGRLIQRTMPVYPFIAKTAGVSGTVTLAATISKTGTIEGLRVTSGPEMLRQAAMDAVESWRYRPYLLDGQPVEVETTVNVIFTLER